MKNAFSIILIVLILLLSVVANITNKKDIPDYNIDLEKEYRENKLLEENFNNDIYEESTENSGGTSSIYIEGLELILEHLPPDAMLDYDAYMNVYADGIISLLRENEDFYMSNKTTIGNVFGIYDYEKYVKFVKFFSKIDMDGGVKHIKINSIKQKSGLLEADIKIYFSKESVSIDQLLSYVYIQNEPMLFIYTKI